MWLNIAAHVSRRRFLSMHPEVTDTRLAPSSFFDGLPSQMDAGFKFEGLGKGSIWLGFAAWSEDLNDLKCSVHVGTRNN